MFTDTKRYHPLTVISFTFIQYCGPNLYHCKCSSLQLLWSINDLESIDKLSPSSCRGNFKYVFMITAVYHSLLTPKVVLHKLLDVQCGCLSPLLLVNADMCIYRLAVLEKILHMLHIVCIEFPRAI